MMFYSRHRSPQRRLGSKLKYNHWLLLLLSLQQDVYLRILHRLTENWTPAYAGEGGVCIGDDAMGSVR